MMPPRTPSRQLNPSPMLTIVLPIAGRGSRFAAAGYSLPKPLIPVHGRPMIETVVRNVRPSCAHQFIFLPLRQHLDHLVSRGALRAPPPDALGVPADSVTGGPACTVLL